MSEAFSFVTLLRIFYTGILVFIAVVLLREVWFIWFDRQMTLGEIQYFDGIKVEQAAADRFRHLLNQEYNRDLDNIRNHGRIFQKVTGRSPGRETDLFRLEGSLKPALLTSVKSFESFAPKERDFANLDISFQGVEIRKLFSSLRSYLSPSVDLNLILTKISDGDMRANIRWPREARPLEGLVKRRLDSELGPYKDDATLARKASCYLLWLQAFNRQEKNIASFSELCLWLDALRMLGALADEKDNLAVNGAVDRNALTAFAAQFAGGFNAEFDHPETYRAAATLISEAAKVPFKPEISIAGKNARVEPEFLAAILNYYYVHLVSNPSRREFFRNAAKGFGDTDAHNVNQEVVGRRLLPDRVVPWSDIVSALASPPDDSTQNPDLEKSFTSEDIGSFGFPRREVRSTLRDLNSDGKLQGTAFLVAPDVALASKQGENTTGPRYVEYVRDPYTPNTVEFQRVAIKETVPLITAGRAGVVALRLERPIPDATPFKIAPRDQARQQAGRSIYLISYLLNIAKAGSPLDAVFKGEHGRPVYLGATILLQNDTASNRQYAYDAFTLPGSHGSPVVDAESGQVIAMDLADLQYSHGIVKIGVGLDITSLSESAVLRDLINDSQQIAPPAAGIQPPRGD
jgi:hypothetical protein